MALPAPLQKGQMFHNYKSMLKNCQLASRQYKIQIEKGNYTVHSIQYTVYSELSVLIIGTGSILHLHCSTQRTLQTAHTPQMIN